jgi:hypothetical protein
MSKTTMYRLATKYQILKHLGLLVLLESFHKREDHSGQNLRYLIIPENLEILVSRYLKE